VTFEPEEACIFGKMLMALFGEVKRLKARVRELELAGMHIFCSEQLLFVSHSFPNTHHIPWYTLVAHSHHSPPDVLRAIVESSARAGCFLHWRISVCVLCLSMLLQALAVASVRGRG
jgi:hypothetical protein